MTTITVNDSAGLLSALKAAKAGDVVQLASGNYSELTVSGLKFAGTVTITSQDPTHMAVLNGLTVRGCEGLTFKGLDMNVPADSAGYYGYKVSSSANVNFDGVKIHGSLDGNANNDVSGLQIRASTNVTVTNSEFQQLDNGISHLDSNGLKIANNYLHELGEDGVRGGGSSNVVVSGNFFTDFTRRSEGDHPDAIQFWTRNTTSSASNITISGNVIARGAGDPFQGIFVSDQSDGSLPFLNVTVTNNLVVGALQQGIGVFTGKNVTIANNTVAGLPDQVSSILTTRLENSTLSNNQATGYGVHAGVEVNDKLIDSPLDGGQAIQRAWLSGTSGTGGTALKTVDLVLQATIPTVSTVINAGNITAAQLDAAAAKALAGINAERANAIHLVGSSGADKFTADGIHDTVIETGAGNDVLNGSDGMSHNTLIGGLGDDKYTVRSANDRVVEDANGGNDLVTAQVDYTLTANVEQLRLAGDARYGGGNELANKITGGDYDDDIQGFGGDDHLSGGAGGADKLSGGDGNDVMTGNSGADTLNGDAGNDNLDGGEGSDSLSGGTGVDVVEGGAGNDTLSGGAGADTFTFRDGDLTTAGDVVLDFSHAQGDRINLSSIDANTALTGNQKFAFIGTGAFHKTAGELRMDISGGVTHVYGDANGDGLADFHLVMPGAGTLVAGDFVL